jgi:hypothetical protein
MMALDYRPLAPTMEIYVHSVRGLARNVGHYRRSPTSIRVFLPGRRDES